MAFSVDKKEIAQMDYFCKGMPHALYSALNFRYHDALQAAVQSPAVAIGSGLASSFDAFASPAPPMCHPQTEWGDKYTVFFLETWHQAHAATRNDQERPDNFLRFFFY
jgi:hypothetical protein